MESLTYQKNLDITPKKLRMLLPKIKRLTPVQATNVLYYAPQKAAKVFYKVIKSAISNAKQTLKVNDDLLQFKLFTVEEGNKIRRYTTGSRGSAKPFKKKYAHIKIILTSKSSSDVKPLAEPRKAEPKSNDKGEVEAAMNIPDVNKDTKGTKRLEKSSKVTKQKNSGKSQKNKK